jgi:predicted nucleic acid-binding protein
MGLGELHALLQRRAGAATARRVTAALLDDPVYRWEDLQVSLLRDAVSNWIERFDDQRSSFVDAVSFEVMRRRKIVTAFAFDVHFLTAGFRALE